MIPHPLLAAIAYQLHRLPFELETLIVGLWAVDAAAFAVLWFTRERRVVR